MSRQRQITGPEIPSQEGRETALGFDNVDFFSEYFLRHGLWTTDDLLQRLDLAGADNAWYHLHRAHAHTFGLDAFSTEQETYSRWVRPMLKALGYEPTGKVEIMTDRGLLAVNHAHLFGPAPEAGAQDTRSRVLIQTEAWGTDLDAARDGLTGRATPTAQAFACLRHADSRARWAIITNGQELRLIGSDLGLPPRAHLSFDLERIFQRGTKKDVGFLLFWGLLREAATRPGDDEKSFLDVILDESRRLAQSVRGALGDVVPRLLEQLVRDMRESNPDFRNEADADEAHRTAVILLYRLLFVAYAEAKGLLPISNQLYRDAYSFESLRQKIDDKQRAGAHWPSGRSSLWPQLQALFRFLTEDLSTPDLPIIPLGGRLFEPDATPWLARVKLNDAQVAALVEGLSLAEVKRGRSKKAISRERINYADLDISELGSIYESLLEYKPTIAREPIAVIVTSRGEQTIPDRLAGEHPRKTNEDGSHIQIAEGDFYLATWNGLRKGSGTYYTPRALTEFQARNALEPLTRDAIKEGKPEDILRLKICDPAMGSAAFLVACVHELAQRLEDACIEASREEKYLPTIERLRGTDLGERVGQALIEIVQRARSEHGLDEQDRALLARLAAEHSIYGVDINPMAVELARVSLWLATMAKDQPLTFVDDRLVPGNSLIGARLDDLDPRKIPEPIIKAQLNDLRGAKRTQVENALRKPQQRTLAVGSGSLRTALEALGAEREAIAAVPTMTVEDARWKAAALAKLRDDPDSPLPRLHKLAHLWAATWFWDDPSAQHALNGTSLPGPQDWQHLARVLIDGEGNITKEQEVVLTAAAELAERHRYFSWELAFPEVFVERSGFDVIIGNPPWEGIMGASREWGAQYTPAAGKVVLRTEFDQWLESFLLNEPEIAKEYRDFLYAQESVNSYLRTVPHFPFGAGSARANTYFFFLQRALTLCREGGIVAQIVPSTFGTGRDTGPLRKHLLREWSTEWWIDFENTNSIFPIHTSQRFALLLSRRQGAKMSLPCSFYNHSLEVLRRYPGTGLIDVPIDVIEALGDEDLAFTEFRSPDEMRPIMALYRQPQLRSDEGGWSLLHRIEFDTSHNRDLFNTEGRGWPLIKGESFHLQDGGIYAYDYSIEVEVGRAALAERVRNSKDREYLQSALGPNGLPCDTERLVFRGIASSTNFRTGIFAVVPPQVFTSNAVRELVPRPNSRALKYYLAGVLGSLPIDFVLRRKVTTNLTKNFIETLPLAKPSLEEVQGDGIPGQIAVASYRLHRRWSQLRPEDPDAAHKAPPPDIVALEGTLNGLTAALYRIGRRDLEQILESFPSVAVSVRKATLAAYDAVVKGAPAEEAAWAAVEPLPGAQPPWVSLPWTGWPAEQ